MVDIILVDRVIQTGKLGTSEKEQTCQDDVIAGNKSYRLLPDTGFVLADVLKIIVECPKDHEEHGKGHEVADSYDVASQLAGIASVSVCSTVTDKKEHREEICEDKVQLALFIKALGKR